MANLSNAELNELIYEATVDCYGEDEQLTGFGVSFENYLAVPFKTTVLGVSVTVEEVHQAESGFVGVCVRGQHRQAISIIDIPLPDPPPAGSEWIDAYRLWVARRWHG